MNTLIKHIVESKFNFNIDNKPYQLDLLSKSKHHNISLKNSYEDHLYIDLGLPSGNLWAMYNIGVNPYKLDTFNDWCGSYFAWGEVETKKTYSLYDYKWCKEDKFGYHKYVKYTGDNDLSTAVIHHHNSKKNVDHMDTLQLEDDAAYVNTNKKYIMPTKGDYDELIHNCIPGWANNYNGIKGLTGRVFTSRINDNLIFFPIAGGYFEDGLLFDKTNSIKNEYGYYWSSTMNNDTIYSAYFLLITSADVGIYHNSRNYGFSVRGILNKE